MTSGLVPWVRRRRNSLGIARNGHPLEIRFVMGSPTSTHITQCGKAFILKLIEANPASDMTHLGTSPSPAMALVMPYAERSLNPPILFRRPRA